MRGDGRLGLAGAPVVAVGRTVGELAPVTSAAASAAARGVPLAAGVGDWRGTSSSPLSGPSGLTWVGRAVPLAAGRGVATPAGRPTGGEAGEPAAPGLAAARAGAAGLGLTGVAGLGLTGAAGLGLAGAAGLGLAGAAGLAAPFGPVAAVATAGALGPGPAGAAPSAPAVGEAAALGLGATVGEAGGSASDRAAASTTGVVAARWSTLPVGPLVSPAVGIRAVWVETVLAKRSKKASGVAVGSWAQPAPQRATGVARRPSSETTTTTGRPGATAGGAGGSAGAPTQPAPSSAATAPARIRRDDPTATPIGDCPESR